MLPSFMAHVGMKRLHWKLCGTFIFIIAASVNMLRKVGDKTLVKATAKENNQHLEHGHKYVLGMTPPGEGNNTKIEKSQNIFNHTLQEVQLIKMYHKDKKVRMLENRLFKVIKEPTNYPPPFIPKILISNEGFCSPSMEGVIFVQSALTNFDHRQAIRKTWGNRTALGDKYKVLFVIGKHEFFKHQDLVEVENKQYRDLLQGDFLDTYYNLTYKIVTVLNWMQQNCKDIKTIIKSDDDTLINLKLLFQMLQQTRKRELMCTLNIGSHIQRSQNNKWYVPENEYPGETIFPAYCFGSLYMFTQDMLDELCIAMRHTPFQWVEDVWFTSAVFNKLLNVIKTNLGSKISFSTHSERLPSKLLAKTTHHPNQFYELWTDTWSG